VNPLRAEFDAIIAEYHATLPQKIEHLERLLKNGAIAELRRELHTLAGSAGTFGLPRVGAAAQAAENFLAGELDPARRVELERLLGALRHEAGAR